MSTSTDSIHKGWTNPFRRFTSPRVLRRCPRFYAQVLILVLQIQTDMGVLQADTRLRLVHIRPRLWPQADLPLTEAIRIRLGTGNTLVSRQPVDSARHPPLTMAPLLPMFHIRHRCSPSLGTTTLTYLIPRRRARQDLRISHPRMSWSTIHRHNQGPSILSLEGPVTVRHDIAHLFTVRLNRLLQ